MCEVSVSSTRSFWCWDFSCFPCWGSFFFWPARAVSRTFLLLYFLISIALVLALAVVYSYPIFNVLYSVLDTTRRLSRGEDSSLVLGGSESEVMTFTTLFNRSLRDFVYMKKELEIKVKERTALLEKRDRELHENEEKFRSFTDSAQDAIIMMNNNGNISYWNRAAEEIFGYARHEIVGRPLHVIISPRQYYEIFHKKMADFRHDGGGLIPGKTIELFAVKKSGEEFPVEISLFSVKMGNKWNAVAFMRDITDRVRIQSELFEAKTAAESASRAKSEFFGQHES